MSNAKLLTRAAVAAAIVIPAFGLGASGAAFAQNTPSSAHGARMDHNNQGEDGGQSSHADPNGDDNGSAELPIGTVGAVAGAGLLGGALVLSQRRGTRRTARA